MKNLPIGIQSFIDLRNKDYLYVDKTEDIYRLIRSGKTFFLSRPRRFGKSLLISTLEEVFKGNKELFEGLYIYDRWDWAQRYPVIRLDFGGLSYHTPKALNNSLSDFIKETASKNGIVLEKTEIPDRFKELIEQLHASAGNQVVVLIDEYDKPIIDHLSNLETAKANRDILRNVYQVLKAADEHLRFIFLTGVSRFAKVSVFSGLNNPNDITLNKNYSTICGYTQTELEHYFDEHIEKLSQCLQTDKMQTLDYIRDWYNGYSWDGVNSVYNPFSTLLLFDTETFSNYWFETGTPTFLINLLKNQNVRVILNPVTVISSAFSNFDIENLDLIPALMQTGYLTVKTIRTTPGELAEYTLGIPNREVNDSLLSHLVSSYTSYPSYQALVLSATMQRQIRNGDAEGLAESLRILLAKIPYTLHIQSEAYYHSMLLLWMKLLGFDIHGEVTTNIGRIDAVWHQPGLTVVAEIKYHADKSIDSLLDDAMSQIRDRRYYEAYLDRKIILMAVAFAGKDTGCRMEPVVNNVINAPE
jgi:hypothetical protein